MSGPQTRIAPKPRRLTVRSPSCTVPAAAATEVIGFLAPSAHPVCTMCTPPGGNLPRIRPVPPGLLHSETPAYKPSLLCTRSGAILHSSRTHIADCESEGDDHEKDSRC